MAHADVAPAAALAVPFTPAALVARNLGVRVKVPGTGRRRNRRERVLLAPSSVVVEAGDFVAVVGPSGAGKTTLLNALVGRGPKNDANSVLKLLRVAGAPEGCKAAAALKDGGGGGQPAAPTGDSFSFAAAPGAAESCDRAMDAAAAAGGGDGGSSAAGAPRLSYVMVDARLLPYLTVQETLTFAAAMKLPELSAAARQARVDSVLRLLKLEACRHTYIGGEWKKGLSTGEKKRINIGIELLGGASVLVLDEPTSGLDSTLAGELLALLRDIARSGRSVVCTVHQPTSAMWAWFDKLILVGNGAVVYQGAAADAKHYFKTLGYDCPRSFNPSDFFLSLLSAENDAVAEGGEAGGGEAGGGEGGGGEGGAGGADGEFGGGVSGAALGAKVGFSASASGAFAGGPPPSTVFLAEAFVNSAEFADVEARAAELLAGAKTGGGAGGGSAGGSPACGFSAWWLKVSHLFWRSFRNSLRSPVVCVVWLLVQALQGLILGGIFWQVKSAVKGQELFQLDDAALLDNAWTQLMLHGVDGRQLPLEALENGVDGNGSQPLFDLAANEDQLMWLQKIAYCAPQDAHMGPFGYPDFFNRTSEQNRAAAAAAGGAATGGEGTAESAKLEFEYMLRRKLRGGEGRQLTADGAGGTAAAAENGGGARGARSAEDVRAAVAASGAGISRSSRSWNGITPSSLAPNYTLPGLGGVMQMMDFNYLYRDWTEHADDLSFDNDPTAFWTAVTAYTYEKILNPIAYCSGYPEVSGLTGWHDPTPVRPTTTNSELLLAAGPEGDEVASPIALPGGQSRLDAVFADAAGDGANGAAAGGGSGGEAPAARRKLITIEGDMGMGQALTDILGVRAADAAQTARDLLDRARSCEHRGCSWIDRKVERLHSLGLDGYDAMMVLVNLLGALYFLTANIGFSSYDALLTFPQERILFNRETAAGMYSPFQYFLAKNIADFPFQVLPALVFGVIFYIFVGLQPSRFAGYAVIVMCMSYAAYGFGYCVAAASPRMEIAVISAPVVLVIWLTIAGFFVREDSIPVWINWFSYISFYKWGFFSLVNNQFPASDHLGIMSNAIPIIASGVSETRTVVTTAYIFLCGLLYRFVAFFALKFLHRKVGLQ